MKRTVMAVVALSFAPFLLSQPLLAHHGFAGRYDEENPVTVTGTVLELQFVNPHSSVIFEVKDAKGTAVRWQAELASATAMHRNDGWTKDTLKPEIKSSSPGRKTRMASGDMNLSHESKIVLADSGKVIHDSIKADQKPGTPAAGAPGSRRSSACGLLVLNPIDFATSGQLNGGPKGSRANRISRQWPRLRRLGCAFKPGTCRREWCDDRSQEPRSTFLQVGPNDSRSCRARGRLRASAAPHAAQGGAAQSRG